MSGIVKKMDYNNFDSLDQQDFWVDHYITLHGKKVTNYDQIKQNVGIIRVHPRLVGGKGGFGSMLRALGAQIEKTTNREACRDLSGRRMRDVNNEKKIANWLKTQEEKEAERKKKKQEKLERILNPPKHMMDSQSYIHSIKETAEDIDNALKHGLSQGSGAAERASRKRPANGVHKAPKKPKGWLGIDGDNLEDEDQEEQDTEPVVSPTPQGTESIVSPTPRSSEAIISPTPQDKFSSSESGGSPKYETERAVDAAETQSDSASLPSTTEGNPETNSSKVSDCKKTENSADLDKSKQETLSAGKSEAKPEPINLDLYDTVEELESLGLDRLKQALIALGLKCGGTLMQRAERLFMLKTTPLEKLDRSHFANSNGKTSKKGKKA